MEIVGGEDDMRSLYEAAMEGSVESLMGLIHKDKLILNKVSLTSYAETPLHISSLLGHLDFAVAILNLSPKMATILDSFRRSPLHLASAEGHAEIVGVLLEVNDDVCFIRDQDGRVPLHLAAMRGHVKVIEKLVAARMESSCELLEGDTVLHLCVKYNHLEALKVLVEMIDDDELVNRGDKHGNTIFHWAVMLKQLQTVKYIVSLHGARAGLSKLNTIDLTVMDMLNHSPKDFKTQEIRDILIEVGAGNSRLSTSQPPPRAVTTPSSSPTRRALKAIVKKGMDRLHLQSEWIENSDKILMTVATLIATMTFQSALNPPGGVWQEDDTSGKNVVCKNSPSPCLAGIAVFGYSLSEDYKQFMIFNSISFVASLLVIFLISSGFPLGNKLCTWILSVAMCTTIVFLGFTYLVSIYMVTPDNIFDQVEDIDKKATYVGIGAVGLVSFVHIVRFLNWTSKKRRSCGRLLKKWKWLRKLNDNFHKRKQTTSSGLNHLSRV